MSGFDPASRPDRTGLVFVCGHEVHVEMKPGVYGPCACGYTLRVEVAETAEGREFKVTCDAPDIPPPSMVEYRR